MTPFAALAEATYISIESVRRDGTTVRTPVWITSEADKLFCWTLTDTGKVKRIANNQRIRLAVCTARGRILSDWVDCTARILDSRAELDKQLRRMSAKYGLLFLPFKWMPRLRGTSTSVIEFNEIE